MKRLGCIALLSLLPLTGCADYAQFTGQWLATDGIFSFWYDGASKTGGYSGFGDAGEVSFVREVTAEYHLVVDDELYCLDCEVKQDPAFGNAIQCDRSASAGGDESEAPIADHVCSFVRDPSGGVGSGALSGTQWIAFDGALAEPTVYPNSAMGISGLIYAYSDGCASMNWDPETRCVSGTLCPPGADYSNWGIGLYFDFDYNPYSNAKRTWNPEQFGAAGMAWVVNGEAPGLEVWVNCMDPAYGGICSADYCAIAGPPDGASAVLPGYGALYFDAMEKADWGGTGTAYGYDPALTFEVMFKLNSIEARSYDYGFCLDDLGVIF